MKTLGKIKLNQLSKAEIEKREMSALKGGMCSCACQYAQSGGSSMTDNGNANAGAPGDGDDKQSYGGGGYCFQNNTYIVCVSGY